MTEFRSDIKHIRCLSSVMVQGTEVSKAEQVVVLTEDRVDMDSELGYTSSTQTLGVKSLGSSTSLAKNDRRVRSGLIFICALLLLVCTALASYLIVTTVKQDEPTCKKTKTSQQNPCSLSSCLEVAGAIKQNLNESVDPCKDFFQYSCGTWIKDNPIPSSENRLSTFSQLLDKNNKKLLLLLLEDDDSPSNDAVKKTKDYFKSCMAEDQNDNTVVPELKHLITRYGSWPLGNTAWNESTWHLPEVLMAFQRDFSPISPLFVPEIDINPFNSSQHILQV